MTHVFAYIIAALFVVFCVYQVFMLVRDIKFKKKAKLDKQVNKTNDIGVVASTEKSVKKEDK